MLIATKKAVKHHGGVDAKECKVPNLKTLKEGIVNLEKQIDTVEELEYMDSWAKENSYSQFFIII